MEGAQKFRDWLWPVHAPMAATAAVPPATAVGATERLSDDVVDALGYVAWDFVGRITRGALLVMVWGPFFFTRTALSAAAAR